MFFCLATDEPPVLPGEKERFSKKEKWRAKSKPRKVVEKNSTSKYNGNGLTAALLKYKKVKNNDKENRK